MTWHVHLLDTQPAHTFLVPVDTLRKFSLHNLNDVSPVLTEVLFFMGKQGVSLCPHPQLLPQLLPQQEPDTQFAMEI